MKWVESVPNFSEGRRKEVVEAIVQMAREVEKVWVLDWSMDHDHNRSVVTLVGEPGQVVEALFRMVRKAMELIDLRNHSGEHPRMGATDVIPLIPLRNIDYAECDQYAKQLGERIASELSIPVYFYEKSASSVDRMDLSKIRKGEFEGFSAKIVKPGWKPDFGPSAVHPSAGVVAVGVREFLIAFNINLGTQNVEIANKISRVIRNRSGGFRYVKAMGIALKEKGIVQVSINMTNFKKSSLHHVFEMVQLEAQRYGVPVVGSEIVGLTPLQALANTTEYFLRLDDFDTSRVIEYKLLDILEKE
ncbi:MAG TPA: glutamate formimidoyltransferase [Thermotogota bacterium]|nr:glutamate formimidoyltransferase [Thermotogota bacterium]HRW93015.1 glutamate formimidoyltransferase [Thermotogota bacterium]